MNDEKKRKSVRKEVEDSNEEERRKNIPRPNLLKMRKEE